MGGLRRTLHAMLRHVLVACGGWIAGVALQLQQAVLADPAVYAAVALLAL